MKLSGMKVKLYIVLALVVCVSVAIGLTFLFTKSFKAAHSIHQYTFHTDSTTVHIHTNMPIDSVEMMLGQPEKYHTYSIAGSEYHTYEYPLKDNGKRISLKLEFKDNKLFNVEQEN